MIHEELARFDPETPLEEARTPPASWYTDPRILELERATVFRRSWQAAGRLDQLARPGDYTSGEIAGEPYVLVHGDDGELRGFFNVCRHHAACVVKGDGNTGQLVCPYHGWTYDLTGKLRRAPGLGAVRDFDAAASGLRQLEVAKWGAFVFLRLVPGGEPIESLMAPLDRRIESGSLHFVKRVSYELACNWKVYNDNYLDGGYHVAGLHKGLASQLSLADYETEIEGKISIQSCSSGSAAGAGEVDFSERLGQGAIYAFVYPNLMINRYGPIMDTNWVLPLATDRTLTVFDYYFDEQGIAEPSFVERSLRASDRVQQEDIEICESVQRGLSSSAFDRGRYALVERPAHHFHRLLAGDLTN